MVKVTLQFPDVISVEEPKNKLSLPFAAPLSIPSLENFIDKAYKGVVGHDGKWKIKPDESWEINRKDKGWYTITHNLNNHKYSLSISLLTQPGTFKILEAGLNSFTIETFIAKEFVDLDFSFSLNFIVSG